MQKAVAHSRHEFSTIRTGRPNPALVERILVDYYGSETPLQQLASFAVPEAQLLVIAPFDKTSMDAIEPFQQVTFDRQGSLGLRHLA